MWRPAARFLYRLGEAHRRNGRRSSLHWKESAPAPPLPSNANLALAARFLIVAFVIVVSSGGTGSKLAVTVLSVVALVVQALPAGLSQFDHEAKAEPAAGVAVSLTDVPWS